MFQALFMRLLVNQTVQLQSSIILVQGILRLWRVKLPRHLMPRLLVYMLNILSILQGKEMLYRMQVRKYTPKSLWNLSS